MGSRDGSSSRKRRSRYPGPLQSSGSDLKVPALQPALRASGRDDGSGWVPRRAWGPILRQLGLAAAAALAVVAWRHGLWANVAILALFGAWLAVETVVRAVPRRPAPAADVAAELRTQRP
jgi:hypothetical protein